MSTRRCGGIGIHSRLKICPERLRVQVPSAAPRRRNGLAPFRRRTQTTSMFAVFISSPPFLLSNPKLKGASGLLLYLEWCVCAPGLLLSKARLHDSLAFVMILSAVRRLHIRASIRAFQKRSSEELRFCFWRGNVGADIIRLRGTGKPNCRSSANPAALIVGRPPVGRRGYGLSSGGAQVPVRHSVLKGAS